MTSDPTIPTRRRWDSTMARRRNAALTSQRRLDNDGVDACARSRKRLRPTDDDSDHDGIKDGDDETDARRQRRQSRPPGGDNNQSDDGAGDDHHSGSGLRTAVARTADGPATRGPCDAPVQEVRPPLLHPPSSYALSRRWREPGDLQNPVTCSPRAPTWRRTPARHTQQPYRIARVTPRGSE